MIQDRKGQSAVWGFLTMMAFIAIASGLVDIYRLYTARNWAYAVAQEAAKQCVIPQAGAYLLKKEHKLGYCPASARW